MKQYKDLQEHSRIIDDIAENLLQDHIEIMNENFVLNSKLEATQAQLKATQDKVAQTELELEAVKRHNEFLSKDSMRYANEFTCTEKELNEERYSRKQYERLWHKASEKLATVTSERDEFAGYAKDGTVIAAQLKTELATVTRQRDSLLAQRDIAVKALTNIYECGPADDADGNYLYAQEILAAIQQIKGGV